ncbi:kelch-like protein 40a [Anticarsia gemmatalis]|uniref:kelch-like protein 40a n=1 Tax=Anticarsia gemmatalis TaxID=129554 RepID=UPI003F764757
MGYLKNNQSTYNQTSLYDRVKKLLVSYEWSDCSFSVSGKIFKAHKLILGISSPVFEAMFYGPLSSNDDIIITDIQPDIFQLILNYIYTDTVEINSIDQAFELLYASRKYLLEHLTEMCIAHIQTNISVDNVIEVLNYPEYMQDKQLVSFALKLFCEHANYLLQEKKNLITFSCLKAILESDQMNIAEKDLIKHVFEWSSYCCEQNDIPDTFENRRDILNKNGLFKLLRFLTLSVNDLEEIVTDDLNNLLLPYEFEVIKKNIKSSNGDQKDVVGPIGLSDMPRDLLQLQWHLCYRCPIRSVAPIIIDSNNFIIQSRVKVNKSVFINSLCVPTRMAPADQFCHEMTKVYTEQLSVSIMCESDNSVIKLTNFMNTVEYDSMVEIPLTEPCFMKKNEWYKICFVWPHNRSSTYSYVVEFRHNHYSGHKVSFEFDDLPFNAGTSGSFLGGLKFCL